MAGQADPALRAPLQALLQSFADRPVLMARPGGNWGDHLIYLGAETLADRLGLRWRTVKLPALEPVAMTAGEVVYVHGGGAYTQYSQGRMAPRVARLLTETDAVIVQGPCTIESDDMLGAIPAAAASRAPGRFFFFAREHRTLELATRLLGAHATVALNEDTAFYLDGADLAPRLAALRPGRYDLAAIRADVEAISVAGRPHWDGPVLDPAGYALSFDHWLRIHAGARTILTNRTHSAICGAILGVPTTMFSNAYHKNRSIWELSLRQRGVGWADDQSSIPLPRDVDPLLAWIPVERVRRSWRLGRWANRLRGVPLG